MKSKGVGGSVSLLKTGHIDPLFQLHPPLESHLTEDVSPFSCIKRTTVTSYKHGAWEME